MFHGKDKRKDHTSREVLDGVDDDIGVVPYMVTVTTTKPITPLFLPDPVVLFTIRLVSGSNFWKRYVCSVTLDPGKLSLKLSCAIFRAASPQPAHTQGPAATDLLHRPRLQFYSTLLMRRVQL
jgi:hypothetical protein